ncbi:cache domain-containing protein [Myxococcota bacterium]|nr:cache domain-containing protein [Myxococcota bacterium]MBU1379351.1 cache domain-containing protein [Myxococcota bacterium]MBU1497045.1 cache domain-containing protein [Myxococcota bacterium]
MAQKSIGTKLNVGLILFAVIMAAGITAGSIILLRGYSGKSIKGYVEDMDNIQKQYGKDMYSLHESRLKDLTQLAVSTVKSYHKEAHDTNRLAEKFRPRVKNVVISAYHIIDHISKMPKLKEEEKKKLALETIGAIRYEDDLGNYVFVHDTEGIMLAHVKSNLVGTNMLEYKDKKGKFYIKDFIKTGKTKGEGFSDYWWVRPGDTDPTLKVTYLKLFKKWGWIIGSGTHALLLEQDIKKQALETIGSMRYGDNDYFWVNDYDQKMLSHITPANVGKNFKDYKDAKGTKIFEKFLSIAKRRGEEGESMKYWWPKPGQSEPAPKMSFIRGFADWNWVVGTGVYIDYVEKQIELQKQKVNAQVEKQKSEFQSTLRFYFIIILGFVLILTISLIFIFRFSLIQPLVGRVKRLTSAADMISTGEDVDITDISKREDEIGELGAAFERMSVSVKKLLEAVDQDED